MENVCYLFNSEVKQQEDGLATGEDASRGLARVVMLDWDIEVTQLARDNQFEIYLHSRYVDDTADAGQALAPGLRWENDNMVFKPELVEEDMKTPPDLRTMREFVKLGSSVNPDVQLTGDCPSNYQTGKMPALDTQIWVENGRILYEHYRKPMANPLVMMECSAMPTKVKRTTLTQEVVRILRNISKELPEETATKHLSEFSSRMKASGYPEKFRLEIIKAGLEGFRRMQKVEEDGGRPVNRPRTWETDKRQEQNT